MQDFARQRGVELAPHGKTTMSPELYRRQLEAGAWGISFATVFQLAVGVAHGVRNAIIANQVVCDADLSGLQALLERNPALRILFLVDSVAQIELIEAWQRRNETPWAFDCRVEIGIAGMGFWAPGWPAWVTPVARPSKRSSPKPLAWP